MTWTPGSANTRLGIWIGVAATLLIAAAGWWQFWWLAVPRYDVCAAVLPAPAGCRGVNRVPTAVLWTAVTAILCSATIITGFTIRRRAWAFIVGMVALVIASLWGWQSVLYADS